MAAPAPKVKLSTPLLTVIMADGATWEVQANNRDLIAYDKTRLRQRPVWPTPQESLFTWLTFLAWSASTREGLTALSYADWETQCLEVSSPDADEGDPEGLPTLPGHEPG